MSVIINGDRRIRRLKRRMGAEPAVRDAFPTLLSWHALPWKAFRGGSDTSGPVPLS